MTNSVCIKCISQLKALYDFKRLIIESHILESSKRKSGENGEEHATDRVMAKPASIKSPQSLQELPSTALANLKSLTFLTEYKAQMVYDATRWKHECPKCNKKFLFGWHLKLHINRNHRQLVEKMSENIKFAPASDTAIKEGKMLLPKIVSKIYESAGVNNNFKPKVVEQSNKAPGKKSEAAQKNPRTDEKNYKSTEKKPEALDKKKAEPSPKAIGKNYKMVLKQNHKLMSSQNHVRGVKRKLPKMNDNNRSCKRKKEDKRPVGKPKKKKDEKTSNKVVAVKKMSAAISKDYGKCLKTFFLAKNFQLDRQRYTCVLCGKTFIAPRDLIRHKQLHEDKRGTSEEKNTLKKEVALDYKFKQTLSLSKCDNVRVN